MTTPKPLTVALILSTVAMGSARGQIVITELWPGGLPGEEATVDWVELTNVGDTAFTAFDQLLLRSSDIAPTFPDGIAVPGGMFMGVSSLAPGASAVFLTDYDADAYDPVTQTFYNAADSAEAIEAFRTVWGPGVDDVQVGYLEATFGGPFDGLDQFGETVFLFEGTPFETGAVTLIDSAGYPSSDRASWVFAGPASQSGALSVLGVDGAFEGVLPANAVNTGAAPIEGLPPIGSPGVYIPEPALGSCVLLTGLLMRRERRTA